MPQTFQVLRCYKCEVFQAAHIDGEGQTEKHGEVHPTKKDNKWKCKVCNEKQSLKRFYGLGTSKECRLHVQKLNGIRGEIHATHCESDSCDPSSDSESPENSDQNKIKPCSVAKKSKWLDFVDTEDKSITEEKQQIRDETMLLNNCEIVLELPRKKPLNETAKVVKNIVRRFSSENYPEPSTLSNNYKQDNIVNSLYENNSNLKHCMNTTDEMALPISNNSKWAQFVDNTQIEDENSADPITFTDNLSPLNPLFSLLDDDLDSVLDI